MHHLLITGLRSGKAMRMRAELIEIWKRDPDALVTVSDPKGEEKTRTVPVRELL